MLTNGQELKNIRFMNNDKLSDASQWSAHRLRCEKSWPHFCV